MKIYFAAKATQSTEDDIQRYKKIIDILKSDKHTITNPYFTTSNYNKSGEADGNIFDDLRNNIINSDCVIAEITNSSVSLGIQIEYALNNKIPVLCLILEGKGSEIPLIIRDYKNALLTKDHYNKNNLKTILHSFLSNFPKSRIKFNMFINQEIDKYLGHLVNKHKKPKSEIIREMIEEKMKQDKFYSK